MLFGNIVAGISSVSSVLNAFNNKKATKKIAKENRKIAEMQFDYNKKEIARAFDYNLKSILREQANERVGAVNEARQMLAEINLNTGNTANVDSESFEHDIKDKTSKDIADNMLFMLDTQEKGINELVNTKVAQTYNLGLNYENALSSINNREIALNNYYTGQIANGLVKTGIAAGNIFSDYFDKAEETGNNDLNFEEYSSNYFTDSLKDFGIKSYDPYKKNYSF